MEMQRNRPLLPVPEAYSENSGGQFPAQMGMILDAPAAYSYRNI